MSISGRHKLSLQEQGGINTTFPGRTEYMQRYGPPGDNTRVTELPINPRPHMQVKGRPLAKGKYDRAFTECQSRYKWPDKNLISMCPWGQVEDCPQY